MARRYHALSIAIGACALHTSAQYTPPDPSGLEGIIVETYYVADSSDAADTDGSEGGLAPGAVTYRVFADLKEGYKLLTVGGFSNHPLTFNTTTHFFNNLDRGEAWGPSIGHTHLDENTVAIDSWLTMGAASDLHWGVPKADDPDGSVSGIENNDGGSVGTPLLTNNVAVMGQALTVADGMWESGTPPATAFVGTPPDCFDVGDSSHYSDDNFAWAVLGGIQSPTPDNKLLLGQFTTDGVFSFCLNLWLQIPDSLVCSDPNCHTILEFYGQLLESDTAGSGFAGDNKFTLPGLCYTSTPLAADCEGVVGGGALVGTACDDGDPGTSNDIWQPGCICQGSVGVPEPAAGSVRVFPNPAHDLLRVDMSGLKGENVSLTFTSITGLRVMTLPLGVRHGKLLERVDLSSLAPGVYTLDILMGDRTHQERIIKY